MMYVIARWTNEARTKATVVSARPMDAEAHWYPGDGNDDPTMDDDGPGWVAFGRMPDGSLVYPMSHPAPRRTREEAVALLDRVFTDDSGGVFIVWPVAS